MVDWTIFFDYIDEIVGGVILLAVSRALIFHKFNSNHEKIIGVLFVVGLALFSNSQYAYLLGMIVVGTLVTGPEFMLKFMKWVKTRRTESSTTTTLLHIEDKYSKTDKN